MAERFMQNFRIMITVSRIVIYYYRSTTNVLLYIIYTTVWFHEDRLCTEVRILCYIYVFSIALLLKSLHYTPSAASQSHKSEDFSSSSSSLSRTIVFRRVRTTHASDAVLALAPQRRLSFRRKS